MQCIVLVLKMVVFIIIVIIRIRIHTQHYVKASGLKLARKVDINIMTAQISNSECFIITSLFPLTKKKKKQLQ